MEEQTSYFLARDVHKYLHCPGLWLIPSAIKLVDISSHRAILPLTTWNLLCNSPRILIRLLTSSGFHLFRFTGLEPFDLEFWFSNESSSLLMVPSSLSSFTCSHGGTKSSSLFTNSLTGDGGMNDFLKSSWFSELEECPSAKLGLEEVSSSLDSSLSNSKPSTAWLQCGEKRTPLSVLVLKSQVIEKYFCLQEHRN